jgi:hypothetical protein
MVRQPKPMTSLPSETEISVSSFDVSKLLDDAGVIMQREIRNLMRESANGKLASAQAKDLIAYTKLLFELKELQEEALKGLTPEQLKALTSAVPK